MRTIACDGILIENRRVLLIKRGAMPEKGKWALPGGRIEENETAEECLKRELREETGLDIEPIKIFGVYSKPERDPRKIISIVYIVKRKTGVLKPGSDASACGWFDLNDLPELAFDHEEMLVDLKAILARS